MDEKTKQMFEFTNKIHQLVDEFWISLNKGNGHFENREFDIAIEQYSLAINNAKERNKIYKKLIEIECPPLETSSRYKLSQNFVQAYFNRGLSYAKQKKYTLGILDFSEALKKVEEDYQNYIGKPNDKKTEITNIYIDRGYCYQKAHEHKLAIEDFTKAIELDSTRFFAFNNRGLSYTALKNYEDGLSDYTTALMITENNSDVWYNRGACWYYFKEYENALSDYLRAVKLTPKYSWIYFGMALVYEAKEDLTKAEIHYNLYLYYAYEGNFIKIENKALEVWANNPYNYIFLMDSFDININEFHISKIENSLNQINEILLFNELKNSQITIRESDSNTAILKYYCGSPVASFIHYDEILDIKYSQLNTQELYYYALCSDLIQIESEHIIEYCIEEALQLESLNSFDQYYLGHLRMLNNDIKSAFEYFLKSKELIPSQIMLIYLEVDKSKQNDLLQKLLKSNTDEVKQYLKGFTKTELKISNSFNQQFQDYFFSRELLIAIQHINQNFQLPEDFKGYKETNIWDAFYLTKYEKEKVNIELRKREQIGNLNNIANEFEEYISNISDKDKTDYLKNLKYNLIENKSSDVAQIFDWLLHSKQKDYNIENQIGRSIKEFKIEQPKLYVYLISYFYFSEEIDVKQAFSLFIYLTHVLCDNRVKKLKKVIQTLIPSDHSKLFLVSLGLSPNLFGIVNIVQALNLLFKGYEEFELKEKSHYMEFKDSIWKYVSSERETLEDFAFDRKFQCFPNITDFGK